MCLDVMDFDGKDGIMQKVAQNGTMYQKLLQYMQLALTLAQQVDPAAAEGIAQDVMATMGGGGAPSMGGTARLAQSDNIAGNGKNESTKMKNARSRSNQASQPD